MTNRDAWMSMGWRQGGSSGREELEVLEVLEVMGVLEVLGALEVLEVHASKPEHPIRGRCKPRAPLAPRF